MRLVENIPHHTFSISIFDWNGKYILKIEHDLAEQVYKFNKDWMVNGIEGVKEILTEDFLLENLKRFNAMHAEVKQKINS